MPLVSSMRPPASFDIGFDNLFQAGQGIQMSESNYRSTQQSQPQRRPQTQPAGYNPSTNAESRANVIGSNVGSGISDTGQFYPSPQLLPPLAIERQQRVSQGYQQQQDVDGLSSVLGNVASKERMQVDPTASPRSTDGTIDPELQRERYENSITKLSPRSEEVLYPSPSVMSDTSGGYSNEGPYLDLQGLDLDWDIGVGENDNGGGGGMGVGMGMGMGQVDLWDGFFFGGGGTGGMGA